MKKTKPSRQHPASSIQHPATAPLPRADQEIAHRREIELTEKNQLYREIFQRIGDARKDIDAIAKRIVVTINNCREIGLLLLKAAEDLPGRQWTFDFWKQNETLFIDPFGNPVSYDHLRWFIKIATNEPRQITDIGHARTYEKDLLALIDFKLEGEPPGRSPAEPPKYFLLLTHNAPRVGKDFEEYFRGIEQDPNYGPLDHLPPERAQLLLTKTEDAWQILNTAREKLKIAATTKTLEQSATP